MKVTIIGGPQDGREVEVENGSWRLYFPVIKDDRVDGPLGMIPKFEIVSMPIHKNHRVYWSERQ